MKLHKLTYIIWTLLLSTLGQICFAQDAELPKFKRDTVLFKTGKLANGINWYIAPNSARKGMANLALVRKTDPNIPKAKLDSMASAAFHSPGIFGPSFHKILSRNGIAPSENGYFHCDNGYICFNFDNMSNSMPESVLDSTFMSIFDLARRMESDGGPSDAMAIIICGDVKRDQVLTKLRHFSLVAPHRDGSIPVREYRFDARSTPEEILIENKGSLSDVHGIWNEARTPDAYMQTVLPVISEKLAMEFGWVVRRRLEPVFALNGVNAWMSFQRRNSCDSPHDEQIKITTGCMSNDAPLIQNLMTRELTRLYTWGVDPVEYSYARDIYRSRWYKNSLLQKNDNAVLMKKCIAAFLYGAPLTDESQIIKFAYRNLPLDRQAELFNEYMRSLLVNTVQIDSSFSPLPLLTPMEEIEAVIDSYGTKIALKQPKDKEEPVSGGVLWSYSSGVNVIYKQLETKGITYFSYALKGSREYADEDALASIAGVDDDVLKMFLLANGIDIRITLNPSDVRLEGSLPNDRLELLLKYLGALSAQADNQETLGPEVYKLLVLVSDRESVQVGATVAKNIVALRKGGSWTSNSNVDEVCDDAFELKGFSLYESLFRLDRNGNNMAISNVAMYALEDALLDAFSDSAMYPRNWSGFPGYPSGHFRLFFGVHPYEDNPAISGLKQLDEGEIQERLNAVLHKLATEPIPASKLESYKSRAAKAAASLSGTAEYVIGAALDRYLNNKNLGARYPQLVKNVSAQSIMNFYASATASNR